MIINTIMTLGKANICKLLRGPFHERFFHRKSKSMEISFCSHPSCSVVIALKFGTWYDCYAAVACAKFGAL